VKIKLFGLIISITKSPKSEKDEGDFCVRGIRYPLWKDIRGLLQDSLASEPRDEKLTVRQRIERLPFYLRPEDKRFPWLTEREEKPVPPKQTSRRVICKEGRRYRISEQRTDFPPGKPCEAELDPARVRKLRRERGVLGNP